MVMIEGYKLHYSSVYGFMVKCVYEQMKLWVMDKLG